MIGKTILPYSSGSAGTIIVGTGKYAVKFIDYDGTILKIHNVNAGESAIKPANPTLTNCTFNGWIGDYTNIQYATVIGASYNSAHTYLDLTINANHGLTPTLYLTKTNTTALNVYNDSTNALMATTSTAGTVAIPLTFASAGQYILRIEATANYSFSTYIFGINNLYQIYALKNVILGNRVTSIGLSAFSPCYSLQSVVIPNSVTSIGSSAFSACSALQSVVIPNSVTSIGLSAFSPCYSLQSVVIPNSVTSIGSQSFSGCSSLQSVVIPNSVTSIGVSAFSTCSSLQSVVIPNSVTSIGSSAFFACYSLQSVVIPNSVTSIGTQSFSGCTRFYEYIIQSTTPPSLTSINAFTGIPAYCKLYVPDAIVADTKAGTNWSFYSSQIYAISTRL